MGQLSVWFDEEGDYLEVTLDHERGHFEDLGDGVFERVDEEGNTLGFAVLNVNERKDHRLPFEAEFRRVTS